MTSLCAFMLLLAGGGCGGDDIAPTPDAPAGCPAGTHLCGTSCVADGPDDPARGCARGCGTPCPIPTGGMAVCNASGLCDVTCTPPYVRSGDGCMCRPQTCSERGVECGRTENGCGGTIDCAMCGAGQECASGRCVCARDMAEPNDSELEAFALPGFTDTPDTSMTFSMFALQSMDDVDYFRARITDGGTMSPTIRVTMRNVPGGSRFELAFGFSCASGGDASRCDQGAEELGGELGPVACTAVEAPGGGLFRAQLQTFCASANESGTLIIRVRPVTWLRACMPYELVVEVT